MPTLELTTREVAIVMFHRMSPKEQAAERARVRAAAREAMLALLSPEKRAAVEKRRADFLAAAEAERVRQGAMTMDERMCERAIKQKAQAEATLAKIDTAVVSKVSADVAAAEVAAEK
jgi:hypothetical protein